MKQIFTLLLAVMAFSVQAQQIADMPSIKDHEVRNPYPNATLRNTPASRWINYGQIIYDNITLKDFFRVYLFPDSTVQVEYSDGWGFVSKHSLGQTFDPTAPNIALSLDGDVNISQWMTYTLDSIAIPYRYFRFQDGAPDTVRVQIYRGNKITQQPDPGWSSGASYANVAYSPTTFMGSNYDLNLEFLIDYNDTAAGPRKFIEFPVGWNMNANELAAVTVTFFPGNPYAFGDTIDVYLDVPPVNPVNAFLVYEFRDRDFMVEPGYFNNELTANSTIRYDYNTQNWNGKYIPGTAWTAGFYHLDAFFKMTYDQDVLVVNDVNERPRLVLYPTPAENIVYVKSDERGTFNYNIINAVGQQVSSISIEAINNIAAIDIEDLPPGAYVIQAVGNSSIKTGRFIKR